MKQSKPTGSSRRSSNEFFGVPRVVGKQNTPLIVDKPPEDELQAYRRRMKMRYLNESRKNNINTFDSMKARRDETLQWATNRTMSQEEFSIARDIVKLTNEYRRKFNLNKVTEDKIVSEAARKHTRNMAKGVTPLGHANFSERTSEKVLSYKPSRSAENVGFCSGVSDVAETLVSGWIRSPGHEKNLRSNCSLIGVYVAIEGEKYYATQIFIEP